MTQFSTNGEYRRIFGLASQPTGMMKGVLLLFLPAILLSAANPLATHTIHPVIGSGDRGDSGQATSALLDGPFGLAQDSDGNVYIAESNAGLIRRVGPGGVVERFAGTGVLADGDEGQAALQTNLIRPTVLLSTQDGLVFADETACRIRKILKDGTVHNLVGTGRCSGTSFRGGSASTADAPALQTDLGVVGGMVLNSSGLLLFTDQTAHIVRRLDSDNYIRTVAGSGQGGFAGDTVAATSALLNTPAGLAYDSAGILYIADSLNCRVRAVGTDGNINTVAGDSTCASASTTFPGGTPATDVPLGTMAGLAYDSSSNSLLIASPGQARVLSLDISGSVVTSFLGSALRQAIDTSEPVRYGLDQPTAVLVTSGGTLISDNTSFRVVEVSGGKVAGFAGYWPQLVIYPSPLSARLVRPHGLCLRPDGSLLVVDAGAERILSYQGQLTPFAGVRSPTGFTAGDGGPALNAQIAAPDRVLCASNGDVYISQDSAVRLVRQGTIGTLVSTVNIGGTVAFLDQPSGLAVDSQGRLLISVAADNAVVRYDPSTKASTVVAGTGTAGFTGDGGAATTAELYSPGDLAFDSKGNLLIADSGNRRIRRIGTDGTISTIAGSARSFWHTDTSGQLATAVGLDFIYGMTIDASDNIYISEFNRVSVIGPDGRINIVSGYVGQTDAGVVSYIDGPLNGCNGLAVDSQGRVYVSLRDAGRVMLISPGSQTAQLPVVNIGGVVTASAFGEFPAAAPGTFIEIYGLNLAPDTAYWSNDFVGNRAPTSLEGTSVTIGGQPAFISYVNSDQVNALVPSNVGPGSQQLTVTTWAGTSASYSLTVNAVQPGLLAPGSFTIGGKQFVAALFPDFQTWVAPAGAIQGVTSRPARPGETIVLYGVGFGPVTPETPAGVLPSQQTNLNLPLQISIGQTPAAVVYKGLAPGEAGLYQFNIVVPNVASGDAVPLTFTLGGASGGQTLYTAVQN